ncbi:hypothetical protein CQW31_13760 [Pseudomonas sp. 382]|nr:hypothetical protein DZC31_20425 [Stenotrophomonas rhizophila]PIK78062.1 hypothetical protein CQW31_13760 [Pseudomonas sp. 382]
MDLRNEGRLLGRSWKLPDVITKAGRWGDMAGGLRPRIFVARAGLFAGSPAATEDRTSLWERASPRRGRYRE